MPESNFIKKVLNYALQFLSSLMGVILTFYIWNFANLNNIMVCEALVLMMSLLFPNKHDDIFFSAALGGLTPKRFLPNPGYVFLLAIFVFIIFNLSKKIFVGFGGKYGTIAFFSNLLACFFAYLGENDEYPFYDSTYYKALDIYIYIFGPLVCGASCTLCYVYYHYFNVRQIHVATNINGLLDSLLLLLIKDGPQYDGVKFVFSYGEIYTYFAQIGLLAALFKQDFVKQLPIKGHIMQNFFLIGYLAGWIYISVYGFFNVGGKNGFMAFLSCNVYIRSLRIINKIAGKKKPKTKMGQIENGKIILEVCPNKGLEENEKENKVFTIDTENNGENNKNQAINEPHISKTIESERNLLFSDSKTKKEINGKKIDINCSNKNSEEIPNEKTKPILVFHTINNEKIEKI